MVLSWPQGAHRPVLTARFPLQGALQTLPVTGREPDTQRSPQTTPPRELLTPAGTRAVSGGLLVATASGHLPLASLICSTLPGRTQGPSVGVLKVWTETWPASQEPWLLALDLLCDLGQVPSLLWAFVSSLCKVRVVLCDI